jgi:hypothetical protein
MNYKPIKALLFAIFPFSLVLISSVGLTQTRDAIGDVRVVEPLSLKRQGNSIFISTETGLERLCDLTIVPRETQYWHWGFGETEQRWLKDGAASQGNFSEGVKIDFFVSLSPIDSANHGDNGIQSKSEIDVVEAVNFADFLKSDKGAFQIINQLKKSGIAQELQGQGVDLIGEYTKNPFLVGAALNWKYVISPRVIQAVKKIDFNGIETSQFLSPEGLSQYFSKLREDLRSDAASDQITYLKLVAERSKIPPVRVKAMKTRINKAAAKTS